MRDNWLSNRDFKSYDDIVDHCYAWNALIDRPWKIMSIGIRQWAHVFLRDQARQADRFGADQSYVPRRYFRRQALMHLPAGLPCGLLSGQYRN